MKEDDIKQTIKGWVEIRVGIEMMDGESMKEIGVTLTLLGKKEIVTIRGMYHPISVKSQRNWKIYARKTCSHAFTTKLKGHRRY